MSNKNLTNHKNENLTERIVALVDIIGFKNMVNDSLKSSESAKNLHEVLQKNYGLKSYNEKQSFLD